MIGFDGTGLTPDHVSWARDHFVNHVRSAGPFPPLRCGHQPYGVLPVTSLDLWQPRAAEPLARDTALRTLLVDLRDQVWRTHLADVPRVGARHDPPDPDADLADVMRADAQSNSYFARGVLGRHYLQHLRAFIGENLAANGFIAAQDGIASKLLARLGITWRPRLARAAYADMTWRVASPLIQNGEVSPWRMLEPNYIAALLALPTIDALIAARPDPAATLDRRAPDWGASSPFFGMLGASKLTASAGAHLRGPSCARTDAWISMLLRQLILMMS